MDEFEQIVNEFRDKVKVNIEKECEHVYLLDMPNLIELSRIYVETFCIDYILSPENSPERKSALKDKVSAIDLVNQKQNLLIFGQPGAGKTTFLQYLAIYCLSNSISNRDFVPFYLNLRLFPILSGSISLVEYIRDKWSELGLKDEGIYSILKSGHCLILLDSLDEIEDNLISIREQIIDFLRTYPSNKMVITCRVAAKERKFPDFHESFLADFQNEQIEQFSEKWFNYLHSLHESEQWFHYLRPFQSAEKFLKWIDSDPSVRDLARNPLLLSLLCLKYSEYGSSGLVKKAELFRQAIDVLMGRWDAKRGVERPERYRYLPLEEKRNLLSDLALSSYDNVGGATKEQIINIIAKNIDDSIVIDTNDNGTLKEDKAHQRKIDILDSFQVQHGLLIKLKGENFYFSHHTFQEYFVAREISRRMTNLSVDRAVSEAVLEKYLYNLSKAKWAPTFPIVAELLPNPASFLLKIKEKIRDVAIKNSKIIKIQRWISDKADRIEETQEFSQIRKSTIRAFYLERIINSLLYYELIPTRTIENSLTLDRNLYCILNRICGLNPDLSIKITQKRRSNLQGGLDMILDPTLNEYLDLPENKDRDGYDEQIDNDFFIQANHDEIGVLEVLKICIRFCQQPNLKQELTRLREDIYIPQCRSEVSKWWNQKGENWSINFRDMMIEYRDIGHDWSLSHEDIEQLRFYYNSNKVLAECLDSRCNPRPHVVREIIREDFILDSEKTLKNLENLIQKENLDSLDF